MENFLLLFKFLSWLTNQCPKSPLLFNISFSPILKFKYWIKIFNYKKDDKVSLPFDHINIKTYIFFLQL